MEPFTLVIKDIIGTRNAISVSDGEKVCHAVRCVLKEHGIVELDFADISIITTPFFHASLGCLIHEYSEKRLDKSIRYINLSVANEKRMHAVRRRVKEYIDNSEDFEHSANKVLYGNH